MFDIHTDDDDYSPQALKEVGPSRIKRDKQDVQKIMDQLNRFRIFQHENQNIVCLATRDIAPPNITKSLLSAHTQGQLKLSEFIQSRIIRKDVKFHDRLQKSKSPTLKTMYQVQMKATISKEKSIKADRNLFQL